MPHTGPSERPSGRVRASLLRRALHVRRAPLMAVTLLRAASSESRPVSAGASAAPLIYVYEYIVDDADAKGNYYSTWAPVSSPDAPLVPISGPPLLLRDRMMLSRCIQHHSLRTTSGPRSPQSTAAAAPGGSSCVPGISPGFAWCRLVWRLAPSAGSAPSALRSWILCGPCARLAPACGCPTRLDGRVDWHRCRWRVRALGARRRHGRFPWSHQ